MKFFSDNKSSGSRLEQALSLVAGLCTLVGVLCLQFGQEVIDSDLIVPIFLALWGVSALVGVYVAPRAITRAYRLYVKGER